MSNPNLIKQIIIDKNDRVSQLIQLIKNTDDHKYRNELIYTLVDNFKDKRIIPTLIDLIKKEDLKHYNASIIYACNEYSPYECKDHISLFVDTVINGDYEASMASAQLIIDFPEPYDWEDDLLNRLENDLASSLDKDNDNKEFIREVLKLFRD